MKTHPLLSLLLSSALFSSCKTTEIENIYVTQREKKGSIFGFINLVDERGRTIADKKGVRVTLADVVPAISCITDTLGRYQLDSIMVGSYHIRFEKEGFFDEIRDLAFSSPGGNQATRFADPTPISGYYYSNYNNSTLIFQACQTAPSAPTIRYPQQLPVNPTDTLFSLTGTLSPQDSIPTKRPTICYYDTVPGVTDVRNMGSLSYSRSGDGTYVYRILKRDNDNFQNGRTYYARIYGISAFSGYLRRYNPATGTLDPLPPSPYPSPEFTFTPRW